MKKIKLFTVFLSLPLLLITSTPLYAQTASSRAVQYLYKIAKDYYSRGDYRQALHEFKKILLIERGHKGAREYIELIKMAEEQKELMFREMAMVEAVKKAKEILRAEEEARVKKEKRREVISLALEREQEEVEERLEEEERLAPKKEERLELAKVSLPPPIKPERKEKIKKIKVEELRSLYLDEELWETQPKTSLVMEIGKSLIMKGKNIKRFLVVTPGVIEVERMDKDTLTITATLRKGSTFLHLWDEKRRWTFQLTVIFPKRMLYALEEEAIEESVEPFKFVYSADWGSYYRGKRMGTLNRESLSFSQRTGLEGNTPYGKVDASANFTKFKESTEVTSYTVGLTDGKVGAFKNFNLRGFDLYKSFSSLSLPGRSLRGANLQGRTFNDALGYDLVWGREKTTYGLVTAGVAEKREEFIQGAQFTLFPLQKNKYSFNYAQGYGSAREDYLKDRVFSVEAEQLIGDVRLFSESAFDEDSFATTINSRWSKDNLGLRLDLRNIEKNFTTITGRPGGRGEIGGRLGLDYKFFDIRLSSDLDVYRDRAFFNPDKRDKPNFDWDMSLFIPLSSSSNWRTAFYYRYTPELLSPQRSIRVNNTYSKSVSFSNNKTLSWFLGNAYQRNRFALSPSSDYERYGFFGGLRFPLIKNLSSYLNYDYSWVEELLSGGKSSPRVLTTGISYSQQLSSSWFGRLNLYYRDEEDTQGQFSFLAGEDSVDLSLGLNYKPSPDLEFFIDGRMRNIWAENPDREAFNSVDIRGGMRYSWDSPFSWNPQGEIRGIVFKDLNGDMKKDKDEQGIPDIRVKVGRKEVVTDAQGEYSVKVRAKKVTVALDVETIPEDYVFSTFSLQKIDIIHKKSYRVNFGLTIRSGIYGVVFYDKNGNGKLDAEDIFIPQIRIILDGIDSVVTDSEGSYFFRNIAPGKHTLKIDVNSLPLGHLPLVKVTNEIELSEGKTYIFHIPLKKKL